MLRATLAALTDSTRSKASRKYRKKTADAAAAAAGDGAAAAPGPAWTDKRAPVVKRDNLPPCFAPILSSVAKSVLENPTLSPLLVHHTASPVVATLLDALHAATPDSCAELCRKIARPADDGSAIESSDFGRLMTHRVGSHLAEKVVGVAPPALWVRRCAPRCRLQRLHLLDSSSPCAAPSSG